MVRWAMPTMETAEDAEVAKFQHSRLAELGKDKKPNT